MWWRDWVFLALLLAVCWESCFAMGRCPTDRVCKAAARLGYRYRKKKIGDGVAADDIKVALSCMGTMLLPATTSNTVDNLKMAPTSVQDLSSFLLALTDRSTPALTSKAGREETMETVSEEVATPQVAMAIEKEDEEIGDEVGAETVYKLHQAGLATHITRTVLCLSTLIPEEDTAKWVPNFSNLAPNPLWLRYATNEPLLATSAVQDLSLVDSNLVLRVTLGGFLREELSAVYTERKGEEHYIAGNPTYWNQDGSLFLFKSAKSHRWKLSNDFEKVKTGGRADLAMAPNKAENLLDTNRGWAEWSPSDSKWEVNNEAGITVFEMVDTKAVTWDAWAQTDVPGSAHTQCIDTEVQTEVDSCDYCPHDPPCFPGYPGSRWCMGSLQMERPQCSWRHAVKQVVAEFTGCPRGVVMPTLEQFTLPRGCCSTGKALVCYGYIAPPHVVQDITAHNKSMSHDAANDRDAALRLEGRAPLGDVASHVSRCLPERPKDGPLWSWPNFYWGDANGEQDMFLFNAHYGSEIPYDDWYEFDPARQLPQLPLPATVNSWVQSGWIASREEAMMLANTPGHVMATDEKEKVDPTAVLSSPAARSVSYPSVENTGDAIPCSKEADTSGGLATHAGDERRDGYVLSEAEDAMANKDKDKRKKKTKKGKSKK